MKKVWIGLMSLLFITLVACSDEEGTKEEPPEQEPEKTFEKEDLVGTWNGAIEVPDQPLQIIVEFDKEEELTGNIDIPRQQIEDFPLTNISLNENEVTFEMALSGTPMPFKGSIEEGKITGTFTQSGQSFPFTLEKGEKTAKQETPSKDTFLSIDTEDGKLQGALMTPDEQSEYPVVLIIPGSGPTTRDGNSAMIPGKNDSLLKIAEALKEEGIASLRYDKRGAGKNASLVNESDLRFERFVKDAGMWIELLKKDEQFTNIAVLGHSQGSLVGMMAAEDSDIDAYISVAGPGRPFDQVLLDQLERALPDNLYQKSQGIVQSIQNGEVVEDIEEPLTSTFKPSTQPFLRSWMKYDPAEQIRELTMPTLIVNGTHDLQVPPEEAELLSAAQPDAELLLIDGMNHVLKKAPKEESENLKTYEDPKLPLADGFMDGIVSFLEESFGQD